MKAAKFTWTNNQGRPILSKLDRVLFNTEMESALGNPCVTLLEAGNGKVGDNLLDSSLFDFNLLICFP